MRSRPSVAPTGGSTIWPRETTNTGIVSSVFCRECVIAGSSCRSRCGIALTTAATHGKTTLSIQGTKSTTMKTNPALPQTITTPGSKPAAPLLHRAGARGQLGYSEVAAGFRRPDSLVRLSVRSRSVLRRQRDLRRSCLGLILGTSCWRGGRDGDRLGDDRCREEYSQYESGQGPHDQLDSRMLGTVSHQR